MTDFNIYYLNRFDALSHLSGPYPSRYAAQRAERHFPDHRTVILSNREATTQRKRDEAERLAKVAAVSGCN